jgi:hypothetical protein
VTVKVADTHGLLAETAGQGTITGNNTASLTLTGTVAQVNADLASLSITDSTTGTDTITWTPTDSRTGDGTVLSTTLTVNAAPAVQTLATSFVQAMASIGVPGSTAAVAPEVAAPARLLAIASPTRLQTA